MRYLSQEEKEKMQELIATKKEVAYKDICIHLGWEVLVGSHRVTRLKLLKDNYEMKEIRGDRPNDLKYIIIREKENSESKRGRILDTQKETQEKKKIKEQKRLEKQKLEEEKIERRKLREQRKTEEEVKKQEKMQKKLEKQKLEEEKIERRRLREKRKIENEIKKQEKEQKKLEKERLIQERMKRRKLREQRKTEEEVKKQEKMQKKLEKQKLEEEKIERRRLREKRKIENEIKKQEKEQKKLEKERLIQERTDRRIAREQRKTEEEVKRKQKEQLKTEKELEQQKLEKQKKIKETMKMREEYKKIGKLEKSYIVDHLINKRFAKYIDKIILDTLIENKGQYTSSFIHMYKKLIRIDMYHLNYLMQKEVIKDIEKHSIITYNDIKNFTFDVSMTMNKIFECALCRLHKRDFIDYNFNFYIKRDIEVDKNKKQFDFDFTNEELILITDIETRDKIIEIEDKNKKFYKDLQVLKNFEKYKNDVINDIDTQGIMHKYTTDKIKSYFKVVILTQKQYNREYRVNKTTLREYKNNLRDEIIKCIFNSIEKMFKEYIITDIQKSIKLDLLQILINGEVDVEMLIEKYKRK